MPRHDFDWGLHPDAEKFLQAKLRRFLQGNQFAKELADEIARKTSTRFFDWVDHIVVPEDDVPAEMLTRLGFVEQGRLAPHCRVFRHERSVLFVILTKESDEMEVALKPESIDDFVRRLKIKARVHGKRHSPFRKAHIHKEGGFTLSAVERRGSSGFMVVDCYDSREYTNAFEFFKKRKRVFKTDEDGLLHVKKLVEKVLKTLAPARAADAFLRAEREYWTSRNKAARVQKKRQDSLGLGFGNHDHHTFRSSRKNFSLLVRIFETLGFSCRERFFAGEKAGWGAQVVEHQDCDFVLFCDLDISAAERSKDFAHKGVRAQKKFGAAGLWVGLHGESILAAGMHHLAIRCDFWKLQRDLNGFGVGTMKPFSNFSFLKQAFTVGERWKVNKKRADALLAAGSITAEEHKRFLKDGAIGSHLENIQRREGFKGFNQKPNRSKLRGMKYEPSNESGWVFGVHFGIAKSQQAAGYEPKMNNQDSVSVIIEETDPRKEKGA